MITLTKALLDVYIYKLFSQPIFELSAYLIRLTQCFTSLNVIANQCHN